MRRYLVILLSLCFQSAQANESATEFGDAWDLHSSLTQGALNAPLNSAPVELLGGFTDLLPHVVPTPGQENAGSCLYMSLTGIAEWWNAKLNPDRQWEFDGWGDFSERYLMNWAAVSENPAVKDWRTDTIYYFNENGGVLNRDYRYTKGYYHKVEKRYYPAEENSPGASYGTAFNWVRGLENLTSQNYVKLPQFDREILFAHEGGDQWAVDVAPDDLVDRIKRALVENHAPVTVIYNHYLYWHAVNIVGFDDEASTAGCEFTTRFPAYVEAEIAELQVKLKQTTDAKEREDLTRRIGRYQGQVIDVRRGTEEEGGCWNKGVFYVRDSIYFSETGPIYDYDFGNIGEEKTYSKQVVLKEYQWVNRFVNHAIQIKPKN